MSGNPSWKGFSVRKIVTVRCLALLLLGMCLPTAQANTIVNGDFSSGLNGWSSQGGASASAGIGILDDNGQAYHSQLYQTASGSGHYHFSFDFYNGLSDAYDRSNPFAFPDSFFATLYFSDNSGFDPNGPGLHDGFLALFDLASGGVSNLTGNIRPVPLTDGWLHYDVSFDTAYAFVIPTFDLYNDNGIAGDSRVLLDNVILQAPIIPEPATFMLIGGGLLAGLLGRRRKA